MKQNVSNKLQKLYLMQKPRQTDLGCEVYIGSSVQQQLGNTHILIVGSNMERCETGLQRHTKGKCERKRTEKDK